jgi:hypothetical protein
MELYSTLPSRRRKTQLRDSRHCAGDELCQLLSQLTVDASQQNEAGLQGPTNDSHHPFLQSKRLGKKILRGVRKMRLQKGGESGSSRESFARSGVAMNDPWCRQRVPL